MNSVACVVVHHKSTDTLPVTIDALIQAGIELRNILVVDNSEDAGVADVLTSTLDPQLRIEFTQNRGYAAAVNHGAELLRDISSDFILVSTHEVVPEQPAVEALVAAMRADPTIAVAGPTLVDSTTVPTRIWSTGGLLSTRSGLPRHSTEIPRDAETPLERAWLDGAFCLYRTEALSERLREDFFLYTEELEFHVRLRSRGWKAVWVPGATASQSTDGTPPFLQARNLQIYLRLWGSHAQQTLSVPYLVARETLARTIRRRSPLTALPELVRGWRAGRLHPLESIKT